MHLEIRQVCPDLVLWNLGVVDSNVGSLASESFRQINSRTSSCITSILLESETQQRNPLASDGVEQVLDDFLTEPSLLVIVHIRDRTPVSSYFG